MNVKKFGTKVLIIMTIVLLITGMGLGAEKGKGKTGREEFQEKCAICHPEGGNVIKPDKPLKGSEKLANFQTFQTWIRNPVPPMTSFPASQISERQARVIYDYILTALKKGWK